MIYDSIYLVAFQKGYVFIGHFECMYIIFRYYGKKTKLLQIDHYINLIQNLNNFKEAVLN